MVDKYKNAVRKTMKRVRAQTSISFQNSASHQICTRIRNLDAFRKAKRIALYFPIRGEVDLHNIWETAPLQGKFCYFPVLNEDFTLSFLPATPATSFKNNSHDIPEPEVSRDLAIPIEELDLIIVPTVAFDAQCTRLGMGKGYYDRTLMNKKKGHFFGVAYQFQYLDFLEPESWDVPLDAVITQHSIYWRNP